MQYTLRNIPDPLDFALRERAKDERKSLNQIALEALARGAGYGAEPVRVRDLGDIAGTWVDDPEFERVLRDHDEVDEDLWK